MEGHDGCDSLDHDAAVPRATIEWACHVSVLSSERSLWACRSRNICVPKPKSCLGLVAHAQQLHPRNDSSVRRITCCVFGDRAMVISEVFPSTARSGDWHLPCMSVDERHGERGCGILLASSRKYGIMGQMCGAMQRRCHGAQRGSAINKPWILTGIIHPSILLVRHCCDSVTVGGVVGLLEPSDQLSETCSCDGCKRTSNLAHKHGRS